MDGSDVIVKQATKLDSPKQVTFAPDEQLENDKVTSGCDGNGKIRIFRIACVFGYMYITLLYITFRHMKKYDFLGTCIEGLRKGLKYFQCLSAVLLRHHVVWISFVSFMLTFVTDPNCHSQCCTVDWYLTE